MKIIIEHINDEHLKMVNETQKIVLINNLTKLKICIQLSD